MNFQFGEVNMDAENNIEMNNADENVEAGLANLIINNNNDRPILAQNNVQPQNHENIRPINDANVRNNNQNGNNNAVGRNIGQNNNAAGGGNAGQNNNAAGAINVGLNNNNAEIGAGNGRPIRNERGVRGGQNLRRRPDPYEQGLRNVAYRRRPNPYEQGLRNVAYFFANLIASQNAQTRQQLREQREENENYNNDGNEN